MASDGKPQPSLTGPSIHESASFRSFNQGGTDYRPQFTQFLSSNPSGADPCAIAVVGQMNKEMVRKQVPMSKEHFETASESLAKGDKLCGFLQAENSHVLKSNGTGFVYNAGKGFHFVLSYFVQEKK